MVTIHPISHATAILKWGGEIIYTDPVGGASAFEGQRKPTLILITDIHWDHLSAETLAAILPKDASLIAPKAVVDILPEALAARAKIMVNGEKIEQNGFNIEAIPMYNIPEKVDSFHTKGRGNGYVVERDGFRVYIAGDTSDIPEMRALKDIDIALIPMNLPYTMDVEEASRAVLAFAPKQVYPYHYRGPDGLSDIQKFKELVESGNPNIEVILLNWYP
ncbi:MBL fold metallo-hydrolase [Candidatus Giovannonibacteria bacterium RIFCSPHIGHO2_02_43_16]|uniref:MBL fold metallo-hydrolase n=1 Tax=Candidatus Giovannonibacteria bacterium RIFCSPHIGHO2_02_43_16 TaxID=1798331 RepID=A0A1F5WEI7_9BACT|nr:MAG: MBL fold metallo-hydrolase [Candidatus Giovannonibacteria bacterium RIFCSPHIGHO2_02_43_16]